MVTLIVDGGEDSTINMRRLRVFQPKYMPVVPLIMVNLRKKALKKRGLEENPIAFPCSFGKPVEDVLKTLKKNHDKTPRASI